MIATIVCVTVFILFFIILICLIDSDLNWEPGLPFLLGGLFAPIIVLIFSLMAGISVHKNEKELLKERYKTILYLEDTISLDSIKDAEDYNKKVKSGNNLWCRFSKEDRDYLLIDIESYLKRNREGGTEEVRGAEQ